ncbi:N-acetyltransferase family protein [Rohdeia mirabilis]|uniref:GNAT family N-acetyltransferase n=1 Tax=Rohdeia mirabilis TaxID=2528008 RepID=UPI003AF39136
MRPATVEDALAICELHVAAWQRAYRGIVPDRVLEALTVESKLEQRRALLAAGERTNLVAERGGAVIGWSAFGPGRDDDAGGAGELYAIYVHPDHWRGGAGRALLVASEAGLAEEGYGRATLWVLRDNVRTRAFYEAGGWRADGTGTEHVFDGAAVPSVRYARTLVSGQGRPSPTDAPSTRP